MREDLKEGLRLRHLLETVWQDAWIGLTPEEQHEIIVDIYDMPDTPSLIPVRDEIGDLDQEIGFEVGVPWERMSSELQRHVIDRMKLRAMRSDI